MPGSRCDHRAGGHVMGTGLAALSAQQLPAAASGEGAVSLVFSKNSPPAVWELSSQRP